MRKNTPYKIAASLVELGWFKPLKAAAYGADGKKIIDYQSNGWYAPTQYRVLSHDEWIAEHQNSCPEPSHLGRTVPSHSEVMDASPSHPEGQPFPISEIPSHPEGTNLYKQLVPNTNIPSNTVSPSQAEGMEFLERFSKGGKRRQRANAKANSTVAQPFPLGVMDVSSTLPASLAITPAALARAIGKKLGYTNEVLNAPWRMAFERMANSGNDPSEILRVLQFYVGKYGVELTERERPEGFEVAYPRLLKELTAQQIPEMNVPVTSERKAS